MTARCDNINDCADKSDEADCSRVAADPTYQRFIVPPPTPGTNNTEVRVGLALSQIMDIRCASSGSSFLLFLHGTFNCNFCLLLITFVNFFLFLVLVFPSIRSLDCKSLQKRNASV